MDLMLNQLMRKQPLMKIWTLVQFVEVQALKTLIKNINTQISLWPEMYVNYFLE